MKLPAMAGWLAFAATLVANAGNKEEKEGRAVAPQNIVGIKVTTDGSVDTSSIETILEGAMRGAKTDEEKVLALYHWYRRLNYHHRLVCSDGVRRNVLRVLNSFGINLCGSQSAVIVVLLQKAGFQTRIVMGKAEGDFGGHTFWEVFYDNRWHCFDTMTGFFVYTRDNPPHVASIEELKADPTLVTRAVEEKRAPPSFLYCMGHQEHTAADRAELAKSMGDKDMPWSTLLFTAGSLVDFWAQAPANVRTLDEKGAYNGSYTPDVMTFTLKPNEEFVRLWDNQGKWARTISHPDFGPHHTCGAADEHDPVNFKYFEPYLKKNYGHTKKCYRWFGNGWLEWKPDPANGEIQAAAGLQNLAQAKDGLFDVQGDVATGQMTIPVKCPYLAVEIELDLQLDQQSAAAETRVLLAEGNKHVEVWKKTGDAKGLEKIVISRQDTGLFEYELRIEGRHDGTNRTALLPRRLRTTFQENIYSLPSLVPGKNVVIVSAAAPVNLVGSKLLLQYDWDEGDNWKTPQSVVKDFTDLPARFEINVAGPKMPRMKKLVVQLLPPSRGAP